MLLNLVETSNANSKQLLWKFVRKYKPNISQTNHPIFEWFTCLSYGIIAALVAKTLFLPSGLLDLVPLWQRLVPMALACYDGYRPVFCSSDSWLYEHPGGLYFYKGDTVGINHVL